MPGVIAGYFFAINCTLLFDKPTYFIYSNRIERGKALKQQVRVRNKEMTTATQLDLQFVQDMEAGFPIAQVIRLCDDAVVAQIPMHMADWLRQDYNAAIGKGLEHFEACEVAISAMFYCPHLVGKVVDNKRVFIRSRKLREGKGIDYRDLHEGDVLVMRSGKRNIFKKATLRGSLDQSVLTLEFMDGTILDYNKDYTFRCDLTPSVCDLMTVERKEWSKC